MRDLLPVTPLIFLFLFAASQTASADIAESQRPCTPAQTTVVKAAIAKAKEGLSKSVTALGSGSADEVDRFDRWFGAPSSDAADKVKQVFERALALADFQNYWCPIVNSSELEWNINEVAAVWSGTPDAIYLSPFFFLLPSSGQGSNLGTIVHELTHLPSVGSTADLGYPKATAEALAKNNPQDARRNANNYRYFVEDVLFGI